VVRKLRKHSAAVTALHNHHLTDSPRVVYVHFMMTGDPQALASAAHDAISAAQP
jgi:hypothetical protein